jgi:hypothetical protein
MTYTTDSTADRMGGLHAANGPMAASSLVAGPFEAKRENETMTLPDALITGLLIVYPALATVVAVVAGLYLSGPTAGI